MSKLDSNRMFVLNDPMTPRLSPALAVEIGLNESILLLQLEFLIAVSNHEVDGRRWTYQSVRDLQLIFPFWSTMTVNRTIQSLQEMKLITIGNHNKHKYDKTRWFALNAEEIGKLNSVAMRVYQNDTSLYQNDTALYQDDTRSNQFDTTIPETTTETTTDSIAEKEISAPAVKSKKKVVRSAEEITTDRLVNYFSEKTKIPPEIDHAARQKLWRNPMKRILSAKSGDEVASKNLIDMAIAESQGGEKKYNISSPNSIVNFAMNIHRAGRDSQPKSGGLTGGYTPQGGGNGYR